MITPVNITGHQYILILQKVIIILNSKLSILNYRYSQLSTLNYKRFPIYY